MSRRPSEALAKRPEAVEVQDIDDAIRAEVIAEKDIPTHLFKALGMKGSFFLIFLIILQLGLCGLDMDSRLSRSAGRKNLPEPKLPQLASPKFKTHIPIRHLEKYSPCKKEII